MVMEVNNTLQIAKGISDYGIMIMICAVFLILSSSLMIACFKWLRTTIENILTYTDELRELNEKLESNNHNMERIAEGLMPETQLRIKSFSGVFFDFAVEKVCRLIKTIREENHIVDREATKQKIRTLLRNIYEDRNSKFDCFRYKGNPLSRYCNPNWIEEVAQVVEGEIYNEAGPNNARAYTNVKAAYDNIKLDFYHRLNQ